MLPDPAKSGWAASQSSFLDGFSLIDKKLIQYKNWGHTYGWGLGDVIDFLGCIPESCYSGIKFTFMGIIFTLDKILGGFGICFVIISSLLP